MVNEKLHIICGNCGQDLKEPGMATWEYVPEIKDEETKEILSPADVFIRCNNCTTIHFLENHIKEKDNKVEMISAKQTRELAKNIDVFADSKQKILEVNKQKKNFICLPFKMPIIKDSIIGASRGGYDCVKIYNEITPEVEATLIKQGFKVKWLKRYVKISW